MKILPNGKVQIKNLETGEERIVDPSELGSYGISDTIYQNALTTQKSIPQQPTQNYLQQQPNTSNYLNPQATQTQQPLDYSQFIKEDQTQPVNQQVVSGSANFNPEAQVRSGLGGLFANAKDDAYNIINGILNIPKNIKDYYSNKAEQYKAGNVPLTQRITDAMPYYDVAKSIGTGLVSEYNQALGEPLKGGDVVGRIKERAYKKPVTTALDILPFIKPLSKIARGSKATEIVSEEIPQLNKLQRAGQSLERKAAPVKLKASVYGASKEQAIQNTFDELGITGSAAERYSMLEPNMTKLSKKIEAYLNENATTVTKKEIIESFNNRIKSNIRTGNLTSKAAQTEINAYLKDIAKATKSNQFLKSDLIDTKTLFGFKKLIQEDMGSIYGKLEKGTPLTAKEQVILQGRNAIDDIITTEHPEIKKMTIQQSHLFDGAPSLKGARDAPPTLRGFGTSLPGELSSKIIDKTGRVLESSGNKVAGGSAVLKNLGNKLTSTGILPPIIANQTSGKQNMQNQTYNPEQDRSQNQTYTDLNTQQDHTLPSITNNITGYNPEQLAQAYTQATISGDEYNAKKFKDLYDTEVAYQKQMQSQAGTTKLSAQRVNLAKSGISSIEQVDKLLGIDYTNGTVENMDLLTKQLIPGHFFSRTFDAALYNATDALLRLRTGAQANPTEIKGYMGRLAPTFGDDESTVIFKLQQLKNALIQETQNPGVTNGSLSPIQ